MRFSELKKGVTYYRYESDFEGAFVLAERVVTQLGQHRIQHCKRRKDGQLVDKFAQTYRADWPASLHATPADAKAALIAALKQNLESALHKLKRISDEIKKAEALP